MTSIFGAILNKTASFRGNFEAERSQILKMLFEKKNMKEKAKILIGREFQVSEIISYAVSVHDSEFSRSRAIQYLKSLADPAVIVQQFGVDHYEKMISSFPRGKFNKDLQWLANLMKDRFVFFSSSDEACVYYHFQLEKSSILTHDIMSIIIGFCVDADNSQVVTNMSRYENKENTSNWTSSKLMTAPDHDVETNPVTPESRLNCSVS
eukprot:TRINITY_DN14409_c0_g4_i1.p1 TRINITY_DN14409_c0_g4~~TRINITY_DN14409_c0_g4_i1.p1  ORF type:complete len:208 (-),score=55.35 TRINITY_DN14409_c0_g4_i1:23-646(-)